MPISRTAVGIDIGSTTAKLVVIRDGQILWRKYERHFSYVRKKAYEMLSDAASVIGDGAVSVAISGSAGLGIAHAAGIPFVQEVFATGETVRALEPDTAAVIELGGEDAKILFLKGGTDERMNGSCAGGTGAFIDQMATLLNITPDELDEASLRANRIYPIASRCGVFAKTDIQPLLNQGASKDDIAASIYQAVVNQTITGLAQGRRIEGKVMFLGGPLYYNKGLRQRFKETLKLSEENAVFPEYGLYPVAMGAAIYALRHENDTTLEAVLNGIRDAAAEVSEVASLPPLFASREDYAIFSARHAKAYVPQMDASAYAGGAYLGIDCGSTTTKLVLIAEDGGILYSYYNSNRGNPVEIVRDQLKEIYALCGERITVRAAAVTGYGEELIKNAFSLDCGIVETIAHFTAAKHFQPKVDFILDIGGQDIKCFKVKNNAIDSIMLNEACSSGCGSFIETFARALGHEIAEFARMGLFAPRPVDLGSRCTVFMNSSVKQAQKDGASVEDISAGLSISIVKNAIYKVIRAGDASELGEHIVVQGGTFQNDAVLRSFETELGREVIRPAIAGLMGAYGAALYARGLGLEKSALISSGALENFVHTSKSVICQKCTNHCHLTVNTFSGGARFISGNKCDRGGLRGEITEELPNLHVTKRAMIDALRERGKAAPAKHGTVGLPLALGMYELAPLWTEIFTRLGFRVLISDFSTRATYLRGQYSIPSDTACYPAKIMHGHMEELMEAGADVIFYPCLSYNINENKGQNFYNCPVVAYYSELLSSNMESLEKTKFLFPYLNVNSEAHLAKTLRGLLSEKLGVKLSAGEVKSAVQAGFIAYRDHMDAIRRAGEEAIRFAKESGRRVMILAGRPYHIDPEISHSIDRLASGLGFAVITEDSLDAPVPEDIRVLNQWTYHSRLYAAAQYAAENPQTVSLVQLVSFGCGIDAVTTDEVRRILEKNGALYTQIKIDEITNLGAVNIRLRSLLGALDMQK
ncbi:MAG: 2-hydroxyglutaryl-CoA dehydratase [Ruminococcaceae bacterium]|nr:2-hydroxyglutaryl-CoA dehydratase [Oscillospiraceae bacterium]